MWKWRKRSDEDFAEEIRANIAIDTDRLVAAGVPADEAAAMARRAFGNITRAQERFYDSSRVMWLDDVQRDIRYALRNMARRPGFAAIAILTLALGIGANTTIFTLLDAVVL